MFELKITVVSRSRCWALNSASAGGSANQKVRIGGRLVRLKSQRFPEFLAATSSVSNSTCHLFTTSLLSAAA